MEKPGFTDLQVKALSGKTIIGKVLDKFEQQIVLG